MGKKRQFDEDEVLTVISEHFWKHGYASTKVDQLSAVSGLTKTSIYNAFGNKEALFLRSVEFYMTHTVLPGLQHFDEHASMADNIEQFLLRNFSAAHNPHLTLGCMVTNCMLELASNEPQLYREAMGRYDQTRIAIEAFFASYADNNGLIGSFTAAELTDMFMAVFQGLRVQSVHGNAQQFLPNTMKVFITFIRALER